MIQNNDPAILQVAQVTPATQAEGPGMRFALWLQGCPLRCPGCCNPEMLTFSGGQPTSVQQMLKQVQAAAADQKIEGVTLLGGEPFAHAAAGEFAAGVQQQGLTVMVFSGFVLEELRENQAAATLLAHTDILVDGPYQQENPEPQGGRRWIGSVNQRIHFLSGRYQADDPRWNASNTLEIRLQNGELSVNGFPAPAATGLWKRPRK